MASKLKAAAGSLERVLLPRLNSIDGELKAINTRIDAVHGKIDSEMKATNTRIDAVNGRIDGVHQRIDGVEKSVDSLRNELGTKIDGVHQRIDGVEKSVDSLRNELGTKIDGSPKNRRSREVCRFATKRVGHEDRQRPTKSRPDRQEARHRPQDDDNGSRDERAQEEKLGFLSSNGYILEAVSDLPQVL